MLGSFVTSQNGTNLLRDPDGFRSRTYKTLAAGNVKMEIQQAESFHEVSHVGHAQGTGPPQIIKLGSRGAGARSQKGVAGHYQGSCFVFNVNLIIHIFVNLFTYSPTFPQICPPDVSTNTGNFLV